MDQLGGDCSRAAAPFVVHSKNYFVVAIELGADPTDAAIAPFVNPPVLESMVNTLMSFEPSFAVRTNLPVESIVMKTGSVPAANGDLGLASSLGTPVVGSRENAETSLPPKFAAYRNLPAESIASEIGFLSAVNGELGSEVSVPVFGSSDRTEIVPDEIAVDKELAT